MVTVHLRKTLKIFKTHSVLIFVIIISSLWIPMFRSNTCNNGPWKDAWSFLLENSSNESLLSPFYSSSISAYSPYVTSPFLGSTAREKNQSSQAFFGADFSREFLSKFFFKSFLVSLESAGSTASNTYSKKVFIGGVPAGTNERNDYIFKKN